jgi:hypothetical protein
MNAYTIMVLKSEGKNHLKNLDVGGEMLLKWILRNMVGECELDSSGSGQ